MRFIAAAIVAVALLTFSSCHAAFAPPDDAYAFTPPAEYFAAWESVQQCAERTAPFARIRWFAVPDSVIPCPSGECSGVWYPPHQIYLTEELLANPYGDYLIVRHEMLHDLLQDPEHPELFCSCGLRAADATGSCPR